MYFSVFRMGIKAGLLSVLRDVPYECSFSFSLRLLHIKKLLHEAFFSKTMQDRTLMLIFSQMS